ncbi:response regulator transcription factor [Nonomuraea antimicrobica]
MHGHGRSQRSRRHRADGRQRRIPRLAGRGLPHRGVGAHRVRQRSPSLGGALAAVWGARWICRDRRDARGDLDWGYAPPRRPVDLRSRRGRCHCRHRGRLVAGVLRADGVRRTPRSSAPRATGAVSRTTGATAAGHGVTPGLEVLSPREREVLALVATGARDAAIAEHLHLSQRTVETHLRRIFTKLGLESDDGRNRRLLAARAWLEAMGTDAATNRGPISAMHRPAGAGSTRHGDFPTHRTAR